jgi:monomeric sarcosine oxidase
LRSVIEHQLSIDELAPAEIERRWPGFHVPENLAGVFDPRGGYLLVEDCVRAHLQAAKEAGAALLPNTEVHNWKATDDEVRVRTSAGEFAAARLVITAGAWATQLLKDVKVALTVRRKSLFWFETNSPQYDVASGLPVYLFELPTGTFYGFPKLDPRGVKVAEHSGGQTITDPANVSRAVDPDDQRQLREFLALCMPQVSHRVADHAVCLYTMSPDENFIVDLHPAHANVAFAAGLSGHGFKFAPVLGRALADVALDGATKLPIEFLSLGRFG